MTARTVACLLTSNPELQMAFERELIRHGFSPRECDAVLLLADHGLETLRREGTDPDEQMIGRTLRGAVDTVWGPGPIQSQWTAWTGHPSLSRRCRRFSRIGPDP